MAEGSQEGQGGRGQRAGEGGGQGFKVDKDRFRGDFRSCEATLGGVR